MFDFEKNLNCEVVSAIKNNLTQNTSLMITGLNTYAVGLCVGCAVKKGLFVAKDLISGGKIAQMLTAFNFKVKFLTSTFENNLGLVDFSLRDDFFSTLGGCIKNENDFVIVLSSVLKQKLPEKTTFQNSITEIKENQSYGFEIFLKRLVEIGYERVETISIRGEFSVKGDTIYLAPINTENLLRIEFFGDDIERLTELNFVDKKVVANHKDFSVYPRSLQSTDKNIFQYFDNVFFDEPSQIESQLIEKSEDEKNILTLKEIKKLLPKNCVAFANLMQQKCFFKPDNFCHCHTESVKNYVHNFAELVQDLKVFSNTSKQVYLFCQTEKNVQDLTKLLEDNFVFLKKINGQESNIHLVSEFLPYSVFIQESDAIFVGTYNLFSKKSERKTDKKHKLFMPKINDYVVHEKHGVGKCVGIEKMKLVGYEKDYIIIEYAGGDKFYLPSEQADDLSAYTTTETVPKLNKLGGIDFKRVKDKVWKSVKEMAFDLLKLYAKREKEKGKIYAQDDYLMEQFEEAFPYEETPDQLRAINDIKQDMESTKIMDRLVCGDVGFGKTEVAIRAIFKAVLSGSQVAFLCPTTILAEQHFQTCQKRFAGFMVSTARFNRLISKAEETKVLKGLEDGSINVVISTHKLLNNKVKFKNLTLLVLDEEQRFGVEDKEKIKNMKSNIDCLALSATPIPRTLHMSLSGIRDISIIDTPPSTRQPIQTFVTEFDEDLIDRAIKQELARQGQVLIIYNRIDKIYDFANYIRKLVPKANVGVAHGRLNQKTLEDAIMKLYAGEFQILVSTTLIENGIDLPTANTLIVIDADKLGLSQAYQIRGRIGRGDRVAYAYFLVEGNKEISQNAFKRLSALMENTALGSGLKIAMADLDIRGAGNVLGKEQSGNMLKVGYDLYYKLLNVAFREAKGEQIETLREVKLDIPVDAFVPENYVASEEERLNIISSLSTIQDENSLKNELNNLEKTYGKVPSEVNNLAKISLLKNLAEKCGAKQVSVTKSYFKVYFYDKNDIIEETKLTILQNIDLVLECFKAQIS